MGFGISLKDTEVQIAALPIGRQPALPSEPQPSHSEMLDVVYDNTTDASIGFEAGVPHSKDVLVVSFMPDVTGAKLYKKFQKPLFGTSIWESRCVFF